LGAFFFLGPAPFLPPGPPPAFISSSAPFSVQPFRPVVNLGPLLPLPARTRPDVMSCTECGALFWRSGMSHIRGIVKLFKLFLLVVFLALQLPLLPLLPLVWLQFGC
jgi:hypothetical protein